MLERKYEGVLQRTNATPPAARPQPAATSDLSSNRVGMDGGMPGLQGGLAHLSNLAPVLEVATESPSLVQWGSSSPSVPSSPSSRPRSPFSEPSLPSAGPSLMIDPCTASEDSLSTAEESSFMWARTGGEQEADKMASQVIAQELLRVSEGGREEGEGGALKWKGGVGRGVAGKGYCEA